METYTHMLTHPHTQTLHTQTDTQISELLKQSQIIKELLNVSLSTILSYITEMW